jgi:hypothetical protein
MIRGRDFEQVDFVRALQLDAKSSSKLFWRLLNENENGNGIDITSSEKSD